MIYCKSSYKRQCDFTIKWHDLWSPLQIFSLDIIKGNYFRIWLNRHAWIYGKTFSRNHTKYATVTDMELIGISKKYAYNEVSLDFLIEIIKKSTVSKLNIALDWSAGKSERIVFVNGEVLKEELVD